MAKAALIVLADTDSPGGLGQVVNALTTAKELKEADEAVLDESEGHPSVRRPVSDGYEIVTF